MRTKGEWEPSRKNRDFIKPPKKVRSVAETVVNALRRGKTNAEALASVKRKHPHSTMSLATVNWYRNRLRSQGVKIATDRECRRRKSS